MENRAVKGCRDLYGSDILKLRFIIEQCIKVANLYDCSEIATPILEHTEVFTRSLGEFSDVVSKEMYSFIDQGQDHLTLRPEFTASVMRAILSNKLEHSLPLKFFSHGPLFRRERPQAGRQRQFHQFNVEYLGFDEPIFDAEAIKLASNILQSLNIVDYSLQLNSLGCATSRSNYQKMLQEYFADHQEQLSALSKIRLQKNPLRILDSKEQEDQAIISGAPEIAQYYTPFASDYFAGVQEGLKKLQVPFTVNTKIVRGLDYYSHTTFEFTSTLLGSQSAIIAGGRYDALSGVMGAKQNIAAIGFAAGLERLMMLVDAPVKTASKIMVIPMQQQQQLYALEACDLLRQKGFASFLATGKKLGDLLAKASSKYAASFVVIIGSDEVASNTYTVKDLTTSRQERLDLNQMLNFLSPDDD